jgi:hypothetical protein
MTVDRSLQRMQAQRAALAKRTEHKAFQRVGVTVEPVLPQFPPTVRSAPATNVIGNVIPQAPQPLRWHNTDNVVRSTGRNDNTYTDWRWGS